jgi:hypothetical protein
VIPVIPAPAISPTPTAPSIPPIPVPDPSLVALEKADQAFLHGNFEEACRAYEEYLQLFPSKDLQDQVLFRMGLAYGLKNPNPDWQRATTILLQVVDDYRFRKR